MQLRVKKKPTKNSLVSIITPLIAFWLFVLKCSNTPSNIYPINQKSGNDIFCLKSLSTALF
jgi:hypothetical protein